MGQLVVRNLEESVKSMLRRRARRHGRSMEEEVRDILRDSIKNEEIPPAGLGTEIAALFSKTGLNTGITELRGHKIRPERFGR